MNRAFAFLSRRLDAPDQRLGTGARFKQAFAAVIWPVGDKRAFTIEAEAHRPFLPGTIGG